MISLSLATALAFGPLAAATAFLITYQELSRHRMSRRDALRQSVHLAFVTLVFFFVFSLAAGIAIGWVLDRLGA